MTIKILSENYLKYRISLGGKFQTHGKYLRAFSRHIGEGTHLDCITTEMCKSFLYKDQLCGITNTWFCRYTALNGMFKWAVMRNHIKINPLPIEKPLKPDYCKPYIYSTAELKSLFAACMTYQQGYSKNAPESTRALLMMTYMLGLRIRETINLHLSDIDLKNNTILIRESKFFKSRILPFNDQVKKTITDYLSWRNTLSVDKKPEALLFLTRTNKPMNLHSINHYFLQILEEAEITRRDNYPRHPRIHDLRHTFAVHRLIAWYKNGDDVQVMLPYLSTYLGHQNLSHTIVYLSMTDDLLFEASRKFDKYANQHDKQS